MGTHIMERSLLLGCLVALVIPANSLKCHSCVGNDNDCNPTEVTCPGENDKCSTTAMYIDSFPCKVRKIFKGCINSTATTRKLSLSPNEMTTISLQQEMCDSDFCNTQVVQDPAANANDLYCYSCISPGASCNSDSMNKLGCLGEQKICVDMKVMGSFGDIADVNIKGCGQIPSCKQNLVFASQTSSVTVQCCDGNFCNSGTDSVTEDKTPNEIQCYSCNTLDGASCSPEEVVKAQCYGDLTSCLEVAGTSMKDGRPVPSVIKGCATPSMCDSSVLPMLQKLGTATVKCCNGSLCNDQFSESSLKASGYLPTGNVSPETGNNTAGRENNSSAGTSESSSFGGYHNTPGSNESSTTYTSSGNGLEMTNEWNSNNNSSNHNMEMPIGYSNIPGANHSSPSYDSAGNITGISNQWISSNDSSQYMAIPGGYNNINGNNDSSMSDTTNGNGTPNQWISSNDSSQYMAIPGGYNNIHGNNDSSMSDTSNGNGTPNQLISSNDSSQYMAIPGGYNNIHGNNDSSMSDTTNGNGTPNQWISSNDSSQYLAIPGGYNNIHGNNDSSMSYTDNETGISNNWSNSNSSNPNTAVLVGYGNIPENNASTTHYTSSSSENGMTNEGSNNSNPNMSVSGGYANMPENNASTTHYTSSSSENGMTNEGSNNSNPNMSVSGGYANMPGNNVSATNHTSSGSGMGMANEGNNSSNPNVSVPGEYANMPGNINHTSSYSSSDNGTGMTNEWINGNSSPPGGNYGSPNGNGSNYFSNNNTNSNSMLENNGSTYGNGSSLANSLGSMGSYLNNIFSEANDNGSNSHTSSWPNEFIPEGSSSSNETAWIYGSNNDPNMLHSNNNNGSFNIYNDMQSLFSKLNGSIHGNISKDINEWIQNNSFLSNLMHTGMNHNGSGPSGYNMNSLYNGSLINYFNSLSSFGKDNITSIFSGGNNESFNISKLFSGWSNTINNPNLMNPHGSSYSNIQNPNLLSLAFPNSNGSTNTNNYFGEAGFNGPPSNTYGVSSEGHNQLSPGENNNYGSNMGHESVNSSSYNSNMMIPGVGSGGPTYGGASADSNNNGHNTNMMGHDQNGPYNIWSNNNISLPDRSTNDSTSGGAGNGTGGANGTFSSASSLWTQSGSFVIFLAIALLVLN